MAFVFGDSNRELIREIADEGEAYFPADGKAPHEVFEEILAVITKGVASHGDVSQVAAQNPTAPPPPIPEIDPTVISTID